MPLTVLSALGTRPEAIKLAPVILALRRDPDMLSRVLVTAQHRELLDRTLATFDLAADVDLDLMRPGQSLAEFTSRAIESADRALESERPDMVLVQGDTSTVLAVTLAAFYRGIPIGHVEAGLRSFDLANPFPEEANRLLTAQLATLHFAPTRRAVDNLLRERVPPERVILTGNPVVDAVQLTVARSDSPSPPSPWRRDATNACRVFVTLHRRESWGEPLAGICQAVLRAADTCPRLDFLYPVHPQPEVRQTVQPLLGAHPRIHLTEPLDYAETIAAMSACTFLVTDSGGLQEEAPVLGKPVLVLRAVTERPEAVEAGVAWLVGTNQDAVYDAILTLATDAARLSSMARPISPFGDGRAGERIVVAVRRFLGLSPDRVFNDLDEP